MQEVMRTYHLRSFKRHTLCMEMRLEAATAVNISVDISGAFL